MGCGYGRRTAGEYVKLPTGDMVPSCDAGTEVLGDDFFGYVCQPIGQLYIVSHVSSLSCGRQMYQESVSFAGGTIVKDKNKFSAIRVVSSRLKTVRLTRGEVPQISGLLWRKALIRITFATQGVTYDGTDVVLP